MAWTCGFALEDPRQTRCPENGLVKMIRLRLGVRRGGNGSSLQKNGHLYYFYQLKCYQIGPNLTQCKGSMLDQNGPRSKANYLPILTLEASHAKRTLVKTKATLEFRTNK